MGILNEEYVFRRTPGLKNDISYTLENLICLFKNPLFKI